MPDALVEKVDHTLVVTMNRPEKRNALSGDMLGIMSDAWDQVNDDNDIRVAILTGAGGAFCAGADLSAMTQSHPSDSFEGGTFDPSVIDRKSTRLNSSHANISYAVFCLQKKNAGTPADYPSR